jgi:hypothetical protein
MLRTNGISRKVLVAGLGVTVATALGMPPASAVGDDSPQAGELGQAVTLQAVPDALPDVSLKRDLLASATPDECFDGVGVAYPELMFDPEGKPYCDTGQVKVNQAYVWGLAQSGDTLWFGTGSNINCLATAQFMAPMTSLTDSYVCEGNQAAHATDPVFAGVYTDLRGRGLTDEQARQVIAGLGDWRSPDLFTYDLDTDHLVKINDQVTGDGAALLQRTVGIRSAGAIGDYVIFAGPDAASSPTGLFGAVNFFVFEDGNYLGAESVDGLTNIRKWVEIDGALYTGVATAPIQGETTRGQVLRFLGSDAQDPIQTEVVGKMTTAPSEFTSLNDRIYTTTWPVGRKSAPAGVWLSPTLGDDGLNSSDGDDWSEVWNIADYEPDPVVQASTAVGAIEALDGHLFWGTMNVPFVGAFSHGALYNTLYGHMPSQQEIILMLLGGHRASALFRASDLDTVTPTVDLLYGSAKLPVAEYANTPPVSGASPVTWRVKRNEMGGVAPLYGSAGFGNPFNAYTWTMAVNNGSLYVGTFDDSYLISAMLRESQPRKTNAMLTPQTLSAMLQAMGLDGSRLPLQYGADLWRFRDADSAAVPEFTNGADNRYSYGVRTIISDAEHGMYLGMANPMNLEVNPAGEPQGGWQLVKLSQWPTQVTLQASPNPLAPGDVLRVDAGVASENGRPLGTLTLKDGSQSVGACSLAVRKQDCTWFVPGLTAGEHVLTAAYSDGRLWASSVSVPVTVVVGAPEGVAPATGVADPPASQPPAATAPAASLLVSARSATKAVKSLKTAQLLTASPAVVSMGCTVNGKVLTGKAARRACGLSVVVGGGAVKVAAKPKCGASRVSVTLAASGDTWTRSWAVTPKPKCES